MNGYVHGTLTRRWALEEGYSAEDAETVAEWNERTDALFPGTVWRYKPWHAASRGAHELAAAYLDRAVAERSLPHLGVAIHCEQDAISHGRTGHILHYPGIDMWHRRSSTVRERIESRTREFLRAYRDGRRPSRGAGHPWPDTPLEPPPPS